MTIGDQPWFVAADVLNVLGYPRGSKTYRLNQLDTVERGVSKIKTPSHGEQEYQLVSESGLYKLVMWSGKPNAKPFQDWVSKEVLPSIRKTGSFVTGQPSLVENPQMTPIELMMDQAYTAFNPQKAPF